MWVSVTEQKEQVQRLREVVKMILNSSKEANSLQQSGRQKNSVCVSGWGQGWVESET